MTKAHLTRAQQEVLRAFGRYYYLSGAQVRDLLYQRDSDASRKYALATLKQLTDLGLLTPANSYDRGPVKGSDPLVWSRTEKGRNLLDRLGVPNPVGVPKRQELSSVTIGHLKVITDTLIALERWGRETPGVQFRTLHTELELRQAPVAGKVLDGYAAYFLEALQAPVGIGLEVDRGTERRFPDATGAASWDDGIRRLVELASGPHEQAFGIKSIRFAVVVHSIVKSHEERLKDLIHWTEDALEKYASPAWGPHFRFTTADPATMSPSEFVGGHHWITPYTYQAMPLVAL